VSAKKPPGLSWNSWIEQAIEQAQRRGDFDDLPGKGKPLSGLTEAYDPEWWPKQLIAREKIPLLPPALAIRRKVEAEIPRILKLVRETDVRTALGKLNVEVAQVNRTVTSGPATTLTRIDENAFLAKWRAAKPRQSS
jgi:hypothetical protein